MRSCSEGVVRAFLPALAIWGVIVLIGQALL